jgi:hypothetical protein
MASGFGGQLVLRGGKFLIGAGTCRAFGVKAILEPDGDILVDGTGVSFLLSDAELGQHLKDGARLDLQFTREFVDANLLHTVDATLRAGLARNAPCSAPLLPI